MKLKNYRIFYIVILCLAFLANASSLGYTLYLATLNETTGGDSIMFSLCFLVLLAINGFQIYSIFHSFKHGSVIFKNLIEDNDGNLNKVSIVVSGIIAIVALTMIIYSSLLLSGLEIPLSGFPVALNILIIDFMILILINVFFFNLYLLVHNQEK